MKNEECRMTGQSHPKPPQSHTLAKAEMLKAES
jgi:hypothetical protein